jgi:hypothetical protein
VEAVRRHGHQRLSYAHATGRLRDAGRRAELLAPAVNATYALCSTLRARIVRGDVCVISPRSRASFALDICLANDPTVFLILSTQVGGEICAAHADWIKTERDQFCFDLRRLHGRGERDGKS